MQAKDLSGLKINRITVLSFYSKEGGAAKWNCLCECGKEFICRGTQITAQRAKSCGCLRKEKFMARTVKHGLFSGGKRRPTKEYQAWVAMKQRCLNPANSHFLRYGGRGICVCAEWINDFPKFLEDMGKCRKGFSLDRINVDANYCPKNCRWIRLRNQGKNRGNTTVVEVRGRKVCLASACRILGVHKTTVQSRRKAHGISAQQAINNILHDGQEK